MVVGAGVVGLAQAYYLHRLNQLKEKEEKDQIILLDKNESFSLETSFQNACYMAFWETVPKTYIPLTKLLKGLISYETIQTIYPLEVIFEPSLVKFFYYWFFQQSKTKTQFEIMNLILLQNRLFLDLIE